MKQNIFYLGKIYIDCESEFPILIDNDTKGYYLDVDIFKLEIKELIFYPYTGTNIKDGQVVVEGVDYELEPHMQGEGGHIRRKFTVAIPNEQPVNSIISGGEEMYQVKLTSVKNEDGDFVTKIISVE